MFVGVSASEVAGKDACFKVTGARKPRLSLVRCFSSHCRCKTEFAHCSVYSFELENSVPLDAVLQALRGHLITTVASMGTPRHIGVENCWSNTTQLRCTCCVFVLITRTCVVSKRHSISDFLLLNDYCFTKKYCVWTVATITCCVWRPRDYG